MIRIKSVCIRRQIFGVAGTPDQSSIRFVHSWDTKSEWGASGITSDALFGALLEQSNVKTMNVATSSGTGFEPRYPEIRSYCFNPSPKWFDPKSTTLNADNNVTEFCPAWYLGAQVGVTNTAAVNIAYTDTIEIKYDGIGRN